MVCARTRWFDMCELGLRAGATGTKRLVGRKELKRGLKALLAAPRVPPAGSGDGLSNSSGGETEAEGRPKETAGVAGFGRRGEGWSEQEVDDLLNGVVILGGGLIAGDAEVNGGGGDGGGRGGTGGSDADLIDLEFREKLMLAVVDGGTKADRDLEVAQEILPLSEKLQVMWGSRFDRLVRRGDRGWGEVMGQGGVYAPRIYILYPYCSRHVLRFVCCCFE